MMNMKKFNELSQNITEEEYRNNGRFHYSDISGYVRNGFSNLVKQEKEESVSLTFGSVVDCLITEGEDVFNEKYCIEKNFSISDNQKSVVSELIKLGYDRIEDIDPDVIIEVLDSMEFYKSLKPETKVKKIISECGEYFKFKIENENKIVIDYQMLSDARDVISALRKNDTINNLLFANYSKVDRFFQLKFNGEYDEIPITAMVDCIYIDHESKKIYPIDLKTTYTGYEWDFPKSFIKYGYWIQGKLYSYIIKQIIDSDDFYKDYTLEGFTFIYVSRINKLPLIWTFEQCLDRNDIIIETKSGNKIILDDFSKPLYEMAMIKSQQRNVPLDICEFDGNDILEHIKNI